MHQITLAQQRYWQ